MIITKVDSSGQARLLKSLYTYTNSFRKRGVSIDIVAFSQDNGQITIRVSGTKGTAEKNIIINRNELTDSWIAYSEGLKYDMDGLSEVTTIVKNRINNLSTITGKL